MTKPLSRSALHRINTAITDRHNVFYWQTDRAITPEETGVIWADRHGYFNDQGIIDAANTVLSDDKLTSLEPLDTEAQTSLGNINSVRSGALMSGKGVIVRCHPRGIKNGYFYVEALAAQKAIAAGLPTFHTLAIHERQDDNDFSFQVLEKLPGTAMKHWLDTHPEDEAALLVEVGVCLAKLHQIKVDGFGPFDNQKAKRGELQGLHTTFAAAVRAGLKFNLEVLAERSILTDTQAKAVDKLLATSNPLLACEQPVIVHNDFADWNILTDGKKITGMLDWDECVGGDPIADIACWSTFFEPSRLDGMLKGYWTVAEKPKNFEEKFELLRLRYTISKMTLRVRRYEWEPTNDVKERIDIGKKHLAASLRHFGIN